MWRSLVAHLTGGQGVVGSNPAIPTEMSQVRGPHRFGGVGLLAPGRPIGRPRCALDEHGRQRAMQQQMGEIVEYLREILE